MSGGHSSPLSHPLDTFKKAIPTVLGSTIGGGMAMLGMNFLKKNKPSAPPDPNAPPVLGAPPTPTDANPDFTAQQRARKLKALQFGFASTITGNPNFGSNAMPGLKATLGQ